MKTLLKCHLPLHLGKYWDKDLSPEDKIKTQQWRAKIMLAAENAKWFEIDDEGTEILHKLDRQGERAVQKKRATQEEVNEFKNDVLNRMFWFCIHAVSTSPLPLVATTMWKRGNASRQAVKVPFVRASHAGKD